MKIYQMLEQCIEQGKMFECAEPFYRDSYVKQDKRTNIIYWYDKEHRAKEVLELDGIVMNAYWTEYDPTVYMDFISACKLSKENGVWIKRKDDKYSDAIQVLEDEIYMRNCETFTYNVDYNDVVSQDWHVVEDK